MPYEKASSTTANARQPQLPTVARGINNNKPPLTPKIAARATPPLQQPNVAVVTPFAQRAPRPESVLSSNGATPRDRDRDDVASPVSAFLYSNITPRSGSRQSRVDSGNTTPNGTPTLDRHDSWESRSGLGISPAAGDNLRRPAVTFSPPTELVGGLKQDNMDSKFFYASDAQKTTQQPLAKPPVLQPPQQQRPTTFFYGSGGAVPPQRETASPHQTAPMLASPAPQDSLMSKFVYANGSPDMQPPATTRPGSVVSTSSRIPTSRPGSGIPQPPYSAQRSASPIKLSPFPPTNSGSNGTLNSPALNSPRSPTYNANPLGNQMSQQQANSRPASQSAKRPSHARSGSLTIAEAPAVARLMSTHSSATFSESPTPLSLSLPPLNTQSSNPATTGFASLLQAAEDFAEDEDTKPESLNSPTKSSSQDNQLNDLVASARRERKVQDLQITNASLEAINRTLERQLRKQTAEIRRYKRLSRSGRLSLNSVGSRISLESNVDGGALARAGMGLDDLSEEESEMEAEEAELDDDQDDLSVSEDSGELSPSGIALRDARHRKKDEERLRLDLSKHQQMLIDSQKINQSLKRCLGWTEELIKEGKRALEYQVRVSEVELGGRVLAPEDVEGPEVEADDEDATITGTGVGLEEGLASDTATAQSWSKDAQDRDSGIELPADGG
ncbi:hypothetical protein B0H66DRAFT_475308 [Apodospora peruviana]|uniref:Uncharacterized protein n=1 Tax=Apodospora peruviana TaxID=516989 RepID=A0AAE0IC73_9PEZI|nr:hypothetical protein B0H66DRAFT_475308 [Apodospora peruviana]